MFEGLYFKFILAHLLTWSFLYSSLKAFDIVTTSIHFFVTDLTDSIFNILISFYHIIYFLHTLHLSHFTFITLHPTKQQFLQVGMKRNVRVTATLFISCKITFRVHFLVPATT